MLTTQDVAISEIGEVLCADGLAPASEAEAVRALLVLLGELLVCAAPGVPSMLLDLVERGPSQRDPTLAGLLGDLEACLLPLNRGATRRVLARLVRETRKAGPSMRVSSRPAPAELDAQFDELMSGKGGPRPASRPPSAAARPRAAFSEDQPTRPLPPKGAIAGAAASAFAAPGAPAAAVTARVARAREPEPETRPKSPFPESVQLTKPTAAPSAAAAAAILRARTSDGPQLGAANANDRANEPVARAWPPSRAVVRSPSGSLPAGAVPAVAGPQPSAAGHARAAGSQPLAAGRAGIASRHRPVRGAMLRVTSAPSGAIASRRRRKTRKTCTTPHARSVGVLAPLRTRTRARVTRWIQVARARAATNEPSVATPRRALTPRPSIAPRARFEVEPSVRRAAVRATASGSRSTTTRTDRRRAAVAAPWKRNARAC